MKSGVLKLKCSTDQTTISCVQVEYFDAAGGCINCTAERELRSAFGTNAQLVHVNGVNLQLTAGDMLCGHHVVNYLCASKNRPFVAMESWAFVATMKATLRQ